MLKKTFAREVNGLVICESHGQLNSVPIGQRSHFLLNVRQQRERWGSFSKFLMKSAGFDGDSNLKLDFSWRSVGVEQHANHLALLGTGT